MFLLPKRIRARTTISMFFYLLYAKFFTSCGAKTMLCDAQLNACLQRFISAAFRVLVAGCTGIRLRLVLSIKFIEYIFNRYGNHD